MITSHLAGGLGNYMFQIAAAVSIANEYRDVTIFSKVGTYEPHGKIEKYEKNVFSRMVFINTPVIVDCVYNEPDFGYNEIPYKKNMKLVGYFQSEKYYKNRNNILDLFSPTSEINDYINYKYGEVLAKETCSIHVRRGDYFNFPNHHPVCPIEYYNKAISRFPKETIFLIFSNDIPWCKSNFIGDNFIFVEGEEDYIDLYLMSMCKHNIIANSSFSWWGAYLNKNSNKIVISPSVNNWFGCEKQVNTSDLLPKTWIQI